MANLLWRVQRYMDQLYVSNHIVPKFFSWECTAITDESFHSLTSIRPVDRLSFQWLWSISRNTYVDKMVSSDDPETLHRLCLTAALDPFNLNFILEVCFPLWFYFTYIKCLSICCHSIMHHCIMQMPNMIHHHLRSTSVATAMAYSVVQFSSERGRADAIVPSSPWFSWERGIVMNDFIAMCSCKHVIYHIF